MEGTRMGMHTIIGGGWLSLHGTWSCNTTVVCTFIEFSEDQVHSRSLGKNFVPTS